MYNSIHDQSKASVAHATSSEPAAAPPRGSCEASYNEQTMNLSATDLNIVEMTDVEYTQLQQILYSHMDSQPPEGEMEAKLNPSFYPVSSLSSLPLYHPANMKNQSTFTAPGPGGHGVHPDGAMLTSSHVLGHSDFPESKMLGESSKLLHGQDRPEKTPNESGKHPKRRGSMRTLPGDNNAGSGKETENPVPGGEARSKPSVRVRLEDRFNNMKAEMPRYQEPRDPGVTMSNLVNLICHPAQLVGVQQQSKASELAKNKAPSPAVLQFPYPAYACGASGNGNKCQTQPSSSGSCRSSCPGPEVTKHQEMSLQGKLSFCYHPESESASSNIGPRNKTFPDQVWIKVGEALGKQTINKRSRSRVHPLEANTERKVLGEIQNVPDTQNPAISWPSAQSLLGEDPGGSLQTAGPSQRREKHNRMERDRRRRIRVCCDELNNLVPFCSVDTDKATTLQWTTAFLKYIQERHGESLKKEFESVYYDKTGTRMKMSLVDGLRQGLSQETAHRSAASDVQ